jgi:hypothetical protein
MVKDELKSIEQQIIEIIEKKGYASLAELSKGNSRQTVMRNLRKLHEAGRLRPFIKLEDSISQKAIQPNEIYFSLITKPQYPHEINKLIDRMCGDDVDHEQAYKNFIELCKERDPLGLCIGNVNSDYTINLFYNNLACTLMSDMIPHLKEKLVMSLTTGKTFLNITREEEKIIIGKLGPDYFDPWPQETIDIKLGIIDKLLSIF